MIRRIIEAIDEKEFTPRGDVLEPGGGVTLEQVADVLRARGWEDVSGDFLDEYGDYVKHDTEYTPEKGDRYFVHPTLIAEVDPDPPFMAVRTAGSSVVKAVLVRGPFVDELVATHPKFLQWVAGRAAYQNVEFGVGGKEDKKISLPVVSWGDEEDEE